MVQNNIDLIQKIITNISQVFIGQLEIVRLVVTTLLARGHLLIEDVPGIGKTLLGIALSRSIDASFRRIQFTNDLLPSDILGLNIFDPRENKFEFKSGPIFSHIILADEINRTTPKTQSALLEAMNDAQVTVDGITYSLPMPFMVIATQNPIEYHGTFPLPEAQLDRFLLRLRLGYPSRENEKKVISTGDLYTRAHRLTPVLSVKDVLILQEQVDQVKLDDLLLEYIIELVRQTRTEKSIKLGVSPRGSLLLTRCCKAYALTWGRDYCIPDDIKAVTIPVLSLRVIIDSNLYGISRITESEEIINTLIHKVPVPL